MMNFSIDVSSLYVSIVDNPDPRYRFVIIKPRARVPARELQVFSMGPDHVVAYDVEDAWTVWCEYHGEDRAHYESHESPEPVDPAEPIAIIVDDEGRISDAGTPLTLTAREWASREGRGFLSSTEY